MPTTRELETAIEIAVRAGEIALSLFLPERMDTRAKGDRDVVTAADMASEAFILARLEAAFPGDGVLGEEGTDVAPGAVRRWCVDPLDGTLNYSRGIPFWSISIALFENDQPVLGVVHDPIRGETFSALAGNGALRNESAIASSDIEELDQSLVHLTVDFNDLSMQVGLQDLQKIAPRVLRTRNMGSAALALAYVAAGRFDAMLHRFAHAWDYGAGVVLIREAGGVVSTMAGEPYDIRAHSMCAAATGSLHRALFDLACAPPGASLE